jgi:hypothetical protein
MVWPTTPVSTANVDAGSDSISAARADILDAFTKLNAVIDNGPGFSTILVAGHDNIEATTGSDFTLVAGTGIALSTNATTRSVTITNSGGGGTGVPPDIQVNTIDTYDTGTVEFLANVVLTGTSNDVGTLIEYREKINNIGSTSGAVGIDVALAPVHMLTATGAITISAANITNISAGQSVSVIITQDGTGGRTLTSDLKFAGGSKTLSTDANSIDVINVFYDGTRFLASLVTGYA